MRHGEVQVAGEGTAGAFLVELQVPNDRLSVGGTVCGLLLSRLAFGGDSVLARTVGAGALRARVLVREAGAPGAVRAALGVGAGISARAGLGAGAGNGSSGSVGAGTRVRPGTDRARGVLAVALVRSEEHTSELQSRG